MEMLFRLSERKSDSRERSNGASRDIICWLGTVGQNRVERRVEQGRTEGRTGENRVER